MNGDDVTATSELGPVSTGARTGNDAALTRSDVAPGGETYEVVSTTEFEEGSFEGTSVYAFEGGCVITWRFTGTRVP